MTEEELKQEYFIYCLNPFRGVPQEFTQNWHIQTFEEFIEKTQLGKLVNDILAAQK